MKIGILQGRLSKPIDGFIQDFPPYTWENEFAILNELGLDHIEWLVNKKSFDAGYLNVDALRYADKITSISCDNLTNKNICSKTFLDAQLEPICEFAVKNNLKSITIPLLEDSKVDNFVDRFIANISSFADKYTTIKFGFELESKFEIAKEICSAKKGFYLTYDIGNITACGYNHQEYIENCFNYIQTVHLKDKTINPIKNVEPGSGNAPFYEIFEILQSLKFKGLFTLQTNRGEDGLEIETISRHKKFFEDLYARTF